MHVLAAPSGWLAIDGSIHYIAADGGTFGWANSGAGPAALCPSAPTVAGGGGLFNGGGCSAGSNPPSAPSLTPAAAANPSIISAVFLVDPISSDTTACGPGDPTTLSGTNGDAISSYPVGIGPVPNKDDLSDVYAVRPAPAL